MAEDNAIAWDKVVLVPNAPPGPARRRPSRYWHTRFDLPADSRVVIHSGSLGDWTGIEAIVAIAHRMPGRFTASSVGTTFEFAAPDGAAPSP